ncbi:MAG TPA: hypothetical protein VFQ85_12000 [Mycobacteriales bacterium]|nr:hypothetical protein [Mycobacteriales bacterium]
MTFVTARRALAAFTAFLGALLVLRVLTSHEPRTVTLARPAPGAAVPAVPPPAAAPPASPAAAPPALDAATARSVLAALDAARAAAYAAPATADPAAWAAPSCACLAEDRRRLRDLAARGLALRGHAAVLDAVTLDGTTVLVADHAPAYTAVDARGAVVARWPASGPRRWRVTLVRHAGRWLLGCVVRAP